MAGSRSCAVTITDDDGIRHSVTVVGSSLYEAAAAAVKQFQETPWLQAGMRSATRIEVEVLAPAERHTLTLQQLLAWAKRPPRSPQETIAKQRVDELLATLNPPPGAPKVRLR